MMAERLFDSIVGWICNTAGRQQKDFFFQSFCKCQVWKTDSSLPRWYRRWEGRLHPCLKAIYFDILDPHFLNVVSCRVVVRTAVVKRRLLFPSVVFLFAGMVMHRTKQASLMTDMSLILWKNTERWKRRSCGGGGLQSHLQLCSSRQADELK